MTKKQFTWTYVLFSFFCFLMLVFPLFEIGNRATPIIMGLPFSFFWVILWIFITFAGLLVLYRLDPDKDEEAGS